MIERTTGQADDYEHRLLDYMAEHQWPADRQFDMMRYIGHHFVSAEATLGILDLAQGAHDDLDAELAGQDQLSFEETRVDV